jgi:hypothetical protein
MKVLFVIFILMALYGTLTSHFGAAIIALGIAAFCLIADAFYNKE